jgi:uncharacterized phosphosugar-binding protein
MTPIDYLNAVRGVLDHLERSQLPAIEQAVDLVIASITNGGAVYCSGIGHGNEADFINRAGGLAAVQPFSYSVNIKDPSAGCRRNRPRPEPFEQDLETVRFAVRASSLRAGDVMLLGSVSGRNRAPVELALTCRNLGIKVIGFTSLAYTARVQSLHPSGKRLHEVADVVIDNGAPYGDAAVAIPGFAERLLPVSGVACIVAGWMLWGRVMEKMAAAGNPPTVFMSVNREGGKEAYEKARAEFERRGY